MPPHSRIVLPYHSGKCPDAQASAKFARLNWGSGNNDVRSLIEPAPASRTLASAIHANGKIHSKAAAGRQHEPATLRFIVDAALQVAQRDDRDGEQECHAGYGRGRGQANIVVLMRLLIT